ncbi:hypothetical protein [Plantactinospora sp. WMMB782]|uniref:hypothetical protein n=1 Tax=Plantactinospora sp. WMMB782 TaxID=3404121 RepID=UPI003B9601F4
MTAAVQPPGPRTVLALMAGRGAYRAASYGSGLVLLALWDADEFAGYAAAVGSVTWLTLLVASGPEKAALALLPRPGGARLERLFVTLAVLPFGGCLALWLPLAATGTTPAARYAAAAALTSGIGCCTVLVGLHRLRGRPLVDAAAFAGLAAGYGATLGLAVRPGITAEQALTVLVAVVGVIAVALLGGLVHRLPPIRPGRSARLGAIRAAALLGVGELLSAASVSLLYALFATTGDAAATSLFYLLLVVSAVLSAGWGYLLRIRQPSVVAWLLRSGPAAGWRLAGRLLGAALTLGVPLAAALAVAIVLDVPAVVLGPAAVALELAVFGTGLTALLVLENIDTGGRRWSAAGAVIQFLVVAATGWFLVPAAGAVGGFAALIAGELTKAAALRGIVARRARAAGAGRSPAVGRGTPYEPGGRR